jgi:transcriptional regulator with XRE-family HTH domain
MSKSIFSEEYRVLLRHLREARRRAGLTQEDVASRIGQGQSFVSKCERGERRIDVIELRNFCRAIGIDFFEFLASLEKELDGDAR